jgi:site-specific DNA recombinase
MAKANIREFRQCDRKGRIAGVYVRVSHQDVKRVKRDEREQHVKQSILTQREKGAEKATSSNWRYQVYEDTDLSGTAGSEDRPELARLLQDIRNGCLHTVILRDASRLSRDTQLSVGLMNDYFLHYGVDLIGWLRPIDIKTPHGRTMFEMEAVMDSSYVQSIRLLSKTNREEKAKAGNLALNPYSYGYRFGEPNHPEIVETEARVVVRVFNWVLDGMSMAGIAKRLTALNIPTKHDKKWNTFQVGSMLHNVRYIGKIRYNGAVYDSPFPPLIEIGVWDDVQKILAANSTRAGRAMASTHLLTGILKCGYCLINGADKPNMVFATSRTGRRTHTYYRCQTAHFLTKVACPRARNLHAARIENFVVKYVEELAESLHRKSSEWLKTISSDVNTELRRELADISQQIGTMEKGQQRVRDQLKDAAISGTSASSFASRIDLLTATHDDLEDQIATLLEYGRDLQRKAESSSNKDFAKNLLKTKTWKGLDVKHRRALLEKILTVYVFEDCVVLALKADVTTAPFVLPVVFPYKKYQSQHVDSRGRRLRGGYDIMTPEDDGFASKVRRIIAANRDIGEILNASDFKFPGCSTWEEYIDEGGVEELPDSDVLQT